MTQEDIDEQILISGFDNIFNNQLEQYNLDIVLNKKDEEKEIIYTGYEKQESLEMAVKLFDQLEALNNGMPVEWLIDKLALKQ